MYIAMEKMRTSLRNIVTVSQVGVSNLDYKVA